MLTKTKTTTLSSIRVLLLVAILFFSKTLVTAQEVRKESDLLGEKAIPVAAYYGVQTARALENFMVSGVTTQFYPDYVKAYAMVKLAAAQANTDVGRMSKEKLSAIQKSCEAVIYGKYREHFLVDLYQVGAGTSA